MDIKVIPSPIVVEPDIMNAKQAASYLKISYWLILKLAREHRIPSFHCGNKVLFRKSTIDQFIAAQEQDFCQSVGNEMR